MSDQPGTGVPRQPVTWSTFASRRARRGEWFYEHFGPEHWVRICFGGPAVPVTLTEDPGGSHYGWVEPDGGLTMVQPSYTQFKMQFPYGYQAEEERGRGWMVRLRVEEA